MAVESAVKYSFVEMHTNELKGFGNATLVQGPGNKAAGNAKLKQN